MVIQLILHQLFGQLLCLFFLSAKSTICKALRDGLRIGRLTIQDGEETLEFGISSNNQSETYATIRVLSPAFWTRIYFDHDLGCEPFYSLLTVFGVQYLLVAEAYMFRDFETSNLKGIMNVRSL